MAEAFEFNINELTLADAEDIEEYTGLTLAGLGAALTAKEGEEPNPPARVLTAIIWIAGRKNDPTFTLAKARAKKVTELSSFTGGGGNPPNAEAAAASEAPAEATT